MNAKVITIIWLISFIGIASFLVLDSLFLLCLFFIPFVATSIYIGNNAERMLRELEIEDEDDEFKD